VGLINTPAEDKPKNAPTNKKLSIEYLTRAAKNGHPKAARFLYDFYGITL
jgi:TPR repeat protein